jgi:hypothetical protein
LRDVGRQGGKGRGASERQGESAGGLEDGFGVQRCAAGGGRGDCRAEPVGEGVGDGGQYQQGGGSGGGAADEGARRVQAGLAGTGAAVRRRWKRSVLGHARSGDGKVQRR